MSEPVTDASMEPRVKQAKPSSSIQKVKIKTRQSTFVFGLGDGITEVDSTITGSRLPTSLQVLRCLMYQIQEGAHENRTRWESAKIVLSKINIFYAKANIPMISERKACEKMIKLLNDNEKIRAIPHHRRSTPNSINRVKQMAEKLTQTFPLWPANVENLVKNAEDLAFLQSMKSDRLATFGSHDKVLDAKVKRCKIREDSKASFYEKMSNQKNIRVSIDASSSDENDILYEEIDSADSSSYIPTTSNSRNHHRTIRMGTPAFIPHDIIKRPELVALATRLQMTPAQQASYTKALIEEAGGDASKVATSYSTANKSRRLQVKNIANTCKDAWIPPKFATLHWDSKLLPSLSNPNFTEERLTVIVGNSLQMKLLGVPAYLPGTDQKSGDIIADLTTGLLSSWNCTNSIINMAFDTTASNTGHITAACVAIQKRLGRALLWSACRHHVGEIILSHVFDDLKIEVSKSPDLSLFTRFRKHFVLLQSAHGDDTDVPLSRFDSSSFSESAERFIENCKTYVITLAKSKLTHCRDDYLEFAKLCLLFLGEETSFVNFKRPGALHKARWMAKLIYSIKICLFEQQIQQLPVGLITSKQQVSKLRDFVNFVTLIYSTWWMACDSALDAPWHDLTLFQSLLKYKVVHPEISESAISAFKKHLWYLTEEMVPLALWSSKVSTATRRALADSMLSVKPDTDLFAPQHRFGMGFGKPKFPEKITLSTTLSDFVGTDSWFLFCILKLDSEFLMKDVEEWPNCASYQASMTNLKALNVVNDCAERGIKLSNDFLTTAKNEQHYQNILQVVEHDREQQPNIRKNRKIVK